MAHLKVWHVMRGAGFSFIWQADDDYVDTWWDGVFARSRTLFEVFETFGLFLLVPPVLRTQRNLALLRCDPVLTREWQIAARTFAVLICYMNDMNMEAVLDHCSLPEDPMESKWFTQGVETLQKKGLIIHDAEQGTIEMVHVPQQLRRFTYNHEVTAAGFLRGDRVSQSLAHPSTGRVATDCEYPTDPWVRPRVGGLAASGQVEVRTEASSAFGLSLHTG